MRVEVRQSNNIIGWITLRALFFFPATYRFYLAGKIKPISKPCAYKIDDRFDTCELKIIFINDSPILIADGVPIETLRRIENFEEKDKIIET